MAEDLVVPRRQAWGGLPHRLARAEAALRRRRPAVCVITVGLFALIAAADRWIGPDLSLALGYAVPISLAAYVFGVRVGLALSLLGVVLGLQAPTGPTAAARLLADEALLFAQYATLAVGTGLLGRALGRLEHHDTVLRCLADVARRLTVAVEPIDVLRNGVEAGVQLTGADGGFVAARSERGWGAGEVFLDGEWSRRRVLWWPVPVPPWEMTAHAALTAEEELGQDGLLQQLGAAVQLGVPIGVPGAGLALVVFRAEPRSFEQTPREALALLALHVAAVLEAAHRRAPSQPARSTMELRHAE